jgi:hypothetical protein
MENLSLNQLETAMCDALSLGYNDAYYGQETRSKDDMLRFIEAFNTSNEQAMLLNCAYGVGSLMGRNDK